MEITMHYCTHLEDEYFQVIPENGNSIISVNRIKGEDYFLEFYNSEGKLIISCNYPSYMHSKKIDLSMHKDKEYLMRVSNRDGVGICLYRIIA